MFSGNLLDSMNIQSCSNISLKLFDFIKVFIYSHFLVLSFIMLFYFLFVGLRGGRQQTAKLNMVAYSCKKWTKESHIGRRRDIGFESSLNKKSFSKSLFLSCFFDLCCCLMLCYLRFVLILWISSSYVNVVLFCFIF